MAGMVTVEYTQAREVYTQDFAIQSIDIVLGLVGGFTGLLWAVLAILLGGYETFKLENSLIGAVYPTSPYGGDDDDVHAPDLESESEARRSLMSIVAQRGKYFYNYSEYLLSSYLRIFCCCACSRNYRCLKRRINKLERHE